MALAVGIIYGKLLSCHEIPDQSKDNKISTIEYNDRKVYECFNNLFLVYCGSPYFNITAMPIDGSICPKERYLNTSDLLPSSIYVSYGKYVSTLTTPSDSPQVISLTSDDPNTHRTITKDNPGHYRGGVVYYSRIYDVIICYKNFILSSRD